MSASENNQSKEVIDGVYLHSIRVYEADQKLSKEDRLLLTKTYATLINAPILTNALVSVPLAYFGINLVFEGLLKDKPSAAFKYGAMVFLTMLLFKVLLLPLRYVWYRYKIYQLGKDHVECVASLKLLGYRNSVGWCEYFDYTKDHLDKTMPDPRKVSEEDKKKLWNEVEKKAAKQRKKKL